MNTVALVGLSTFVLATANIAAAQQDAAQGEKAFESQCASATRSSPA